MPCIIKVIIIIDNLYGKIRFAKIRDIYAICSIFKYFLAEVITLWHQYTHSLQLSVRKR